MMAVCLSLTSFMAQTSQKSLELKMEKSPSIIEFAAGSLEARIAKAEQDIQENRIETLKSLHTIRRMIQEFENQPK